MIEIAPVACESAVWIAVPLPPLRVCWRKTHPILPFVPRPRSIALGG
jgi:hypothetical protein